MRARPEKEEWAEQAGAIALPRKVPRPSVTPKLVPKETWQSSPNSRKCTWLCVRTRVLTPVLPLITETTEKVADSSRPVSSPFYKIP